MRGLLWVLLAITTSGSAQVIEQVEGETTVYSDDGGQTITVELPGGVPLEMVWIEPGTFMMGSPDTEIGRHEGETQHGVTISQGFYLGKYELTQGQWVSVIETKWWLEIDAPTVVRRDPQTFVIDNPDRPAVYISWNEMQTFISGFNEAGGDTLYRLPTEAEWEYACRAGTTTRWSSGDNEDELGGYAWYYENAGNLLLQWGQPVGTKLPNPWGLYNMHGNVWEWVQDWYDWGYYGQSPAVDPRGPSSGFKRVIRGGFVMTSAENSRSASRFAEGPGVFSFLIGARLARNGPKLTNATAIPSSTWGQVKQERR